jgi:Ca-activated chloride channel family protein
VKLDAIAPGEGLRAAAALFARESVEDLELGRAAGALPEAIDARIEQLGLDFQIATRLTTWVAISQEVNVDPAAPTRRELVPQELPHGVSAEGVGLRAAASAPGSFGAAASAQVQIGAAAASGGGGPAQPSMHRSLARLSPGDLAVDQLAATESAPGGAALPSALAAKPSVAKQAPASKRGAGLGGVFGKAREVLTSILEPQLDAEETGEAPPTPPATSVLKESESAKAPPAPPSAAPLRVLAAQIRWRKDGLLALEIAIDAQLVWTLPAQVAARLRDGRLVQLEVDLAQSTGAGVLERGQVARLVLRTDEEPLELIVDARLRLAVSAA